ncbi:MAG: hypothetical protein OXQ89_22205 [Rhodospirillaceae bacterium]|nr:hypothetical protein [Rhodospirillaceae bacterium]
MTNSSLPLKKISTITLTVSFLTRPTSACLKRENACSSFATVNGQSRQLRDCPARDSRQRAQLLIQQVLGMPGRLTTDDVQKGPCGERTGRWQNSVLTYRF